MKVLDTLDVVLESIGYDSVTGKRYTLPVTKKSEEDTDELEGLLLPLDSFFQSDGVLSAGLSSVNGQGMDSAERFEDQVLFLIPSDQRAVARWMGLLAVDLSTNAYRHAVARTRNGSYTLEAYVGSRGVAIGTTQQSGFFTSEQIGFLRSGRRIPTTSQPSIGRIGGHNLGMDRLFSSDALCVDDKRMAIYAAKYFQ